MKKHYTPLFVLLILFLFNSNAQTPIAAYRLDGNANDLSGNNFNGTIYGNPLATTNRFNHSGEAMSFHGDSDNVMLPLSADFPSRTVIAWINPAQIGGGDGYNVAYVSDHAAIQNGYTVFATAFDNVQGNIILLHCDQFTFDTAANTNQWYQLAITRSPSEVKFFLNGTLVHSGTNPNGLHSGNGIAQAVIGSSRNSNEFFNGKIDDVLIYNTALSDSEITLNYNAWKDSIVQITGKVFFDANANQLFDSAEQPVRNQVVNVGSSYTALTNNNGDYIVYPDAGTYTIKPQLSGAIAAFPVSPDSLIVQADSLGTVYSNNNFGIVAPPSYCEGSLTIVANTPPARPGFNNVINLRYVNALSSTAVSQTVQFNYAPQQTYVSATPAPTSVDTLNHILTWSVSNISSGTLWQALVTCHTPQIVAIGSILEMTALVSNSTCSSLDSLATGEDIIVVGSFDPNDKAVSPVGQEPGGRILPSTPLSYTIRFQNTGTYLAETVTVVDTISNLLNLSTLKVEAASHNYEVLVNGREVRFRFNQINLPDSNANEALSHGFVKYSITPSASFVQGSVVENLADIYFDFNSAIRTNTTQNTADNFLGIAKINATGANITVYPNPLSSGNLQVITDAAMIGKEIKIYDAAGRIVYTSRVSAKQFEVDATRFSQGVYLLKIENSVVRVVKL